MTNTIQERPKTSSPSRRPSSGRPPAIRKPPVGRAARRRRRLFIGAAVLVALALGLTMLRSGGLDPSPPEVIRGTPAWALQHYDNPDRPGFKKRNIVPIEFLGRTMFVHRKASRHFLRLARLFEARAPEYAAAVRLGELDDWSYQNRSVRGDSFKSNHAFGIAVDLNALTNPLGTPGDMPEDVVRQWEVEGGEWGGDWSRADPMHFETHLTPKEIRARYRADGTPRPWYLDQLIAE